jgi:PAS domain S-box-containing protein
MATPFSKAFEDARMRDVMQRVSRAVASGSADIFHELIRGAAEALGTDYAFIGENVPEQPDRANMLAFYDRGEFAPPFTYDLELTPCRSVVNQTFRFYPRDVRSIFGDPHLKEINADGYAAIPLYDSNGLGIGLMGVMHREPLTDEALIESVLRILSVRAAAELERRYAIRAKEHSDVSYRSLFESTDDAVFVNDIESAAIIDANSTACARYGYTRDELLCLSVRDLGSGEAPYTHAQAVEFFGLAAAGEPVTFEWRARNKDGSQRWEEVRVKRRTIGGVDRILVFTCDITERKRAEAERERYEAQLRQSQKMEAIGQLTGGIAHDFNNILTGVMGYIVMAQERSLTTQDEQSVKYLERAQRAVQRARDLIQQMLTFSRGQRGSASPQDVVALARESVKLLESSLPSTVEIHTNFQHNLPQVRLDPVQFEQVLMNLCINARDAMDGHGRLDVELRLHDCPDCVCTSCRKSFRGGWVVLTVSDTGAGLSAELLDRIFEPFYTTKEVGKGSGMGLAMVHGIVHEHGGHVLVESAPDRGARFHVMFPGVASDRASRSEQPDAARVARPVRINGRVLLVDDDATAREFMHDRLTDWGLRVTSFDDAESALKHFDAHADEFDVAILDQTMPRMTGIELARRLILKRPDLPKLLYTGYGGAGLDSQIQSAGIQAVLRKPVSEAELLARLREIL